MSAVARVAEQSLAPTTISFDPGKWFYGIAVFGVLLLLLWIVSRVNIDRSLSTRAKVVVGLLSSVGIVAMAAGLIASLNVST